MSNARQWNEVASSCDRLEGAITTLWVQLERVRAVVFDVETAPGSYVEVRYRVVRADEDFDEHALRRAVVANDAYARAVAREWLLREMLRPLRQPGDREVLDTEDLDVSHPLFGVLDVGFVLAPKSWTPPPGAQIMV